VASLQLAFSGYGSALEDGESLQTGFTKAGRIGFQEESKGLMNRLPNPVSVSPPKGSEIELIHAFISEMRFSECPVTSCQS